MADGVALNMECKERVRNRLHGLEGGSIDTRDTLSLWASHAGVSRSTLGKILHKSKSIPVARKYVLSVLQSVGMLADENECLQDGRHIDVIPATYTDLITFAESEFHCFGRPERRHEETYQDNYIQKQHKILATMYSANPHGFYVFKSQRTRWGSIVMIPLRADLAQDFLNGQDAEEHLEARHICAPGNRESTLLYIESLIVAGLMEIDRLEFLEYLMGNHFARMVEALCDPTNPNLTIAALGVGNWAGLQRYGFRLHSRAGERVDGRDMHLCLYSDFQERLPDVLARMKSAIRSRRRLLK